MKRNAIQSAVKERGRSTIVTRKEVAWLAGVSEATVSRVLNGIGPMKESTRHKVLDAVRELGYQPNEIARSFASRRSCNLGVLVPYLPNVHLFSAYYFSEILSGIGSVVREYGYDMLLVYRKPDEALDLTALFRSQKVDACVLLGTKDVPGELDALRELQSLSLPFVLVNQRFGEFNEVDADHAEGSRKAVRHLLDQGWRRVAIVNGPLEYSNSRDRYQGYLQALSEGGLPQDSRLRHAGNYSRTSAYRLSPAIAEQIRSGEADAVFAANDRMAFGLMQGLREHGLLAGRDYGIVGYDDSDAAGWMDPPLTTVRVPFFEMGAAAARRLLQRLPPTQKDADDEPFRMVMETELVVRSSSIRR